MGRDFVIRKKVQILRLHQLSTTDYIYMLSFIELCSKFVDLGEVDQSAKLLNETLFGVIFGPSQMADKLQNIAPHKKLASKNQSVNCNVCVTPLESESK